MNNLMAVSDLARYAASPTKYCESPTDAYDPAAAARGIRKHNNLASVKWWAKLLPFVIAVLMFVLIAASWWVSVFSS